MIINPGAISRMLRQEIIFYDYSLGFSVRWPTFEHNIIFFSVSKTQIFLKWFNSMVDCLLTPHSLSRDCCHCLSTCTAPGLAPVSCWLISTRLRFHQFTEWSSHSSLISSHNQPCKSEFEWAGPLCWTIFFYSVCGAVLLFHVITACDRH